MFFFLTMLGTLEVTMITKKRLPKIVFLVPSWRSLWLKNKNHNCYYKYE